MDTEQPTCHWHPDVPTRLRCSACETLICTDCAGDAVVGYKCPDCLRADAGSSPPARSGGRPSAALWGGGPRSGTSRPTPDQPGEPLPTEVTTKATLVGAGAALAGGVLMIPILLGGTFLLISSGVIGWGVARSVYWASGERNSPYLRSLALGLAGATVLVAILLGGGGAPGGGVGGLEALALPAAVYGGWIVVRQR